MELSDNMAKVLSARVRDDLLDELRSRGLRPGDRIPTEAEVGELFRVSRSTVREALRLLEESGAVRVERGKGRFLSAGGALHVERPIDRFESVTEMLESLGHRVTTAVLGIEEGAPTEAEATSLDLGPDAQVVRLARLRYGDDRLLIYSVDAVPRDCLPGPLEHRDWSGSLTVMLAGQGHTVDSSIARIRAAQLPAEVGDRPGLDQREPWLLVEETCVSRAGRRVLLAQDFHRGEDIAFHVVRRR